MTTLDSTTDARFEELTAGMRAELLAHCYRLLGSAAEAEDQVQETYLRAWRAFDAFEGRSSVRTWMYTIATNTCLTALKSGARRPLPTGLGQPAGDPRAPLSTSPEVPWLEPLPDAMVWGTPAADPAEATVTGEGVALATVAALQVLPPRQRAALVLRDVLMFSAAETARMLGCSVPAANSALQRARARLARERLRPDGRAARDLDEHDRQLCEAFLDAFRRYDVPAIVNLLADDATWEMPPFPGWYEGATAIGDLIGTQCPASRPGDLAVLSASFNGQPGLAMYLRDDRGYAAFQVEVLDVVAGRVAHVAAFFDRHLFRLAGLPMRLAPDGRTPA